MKILTSIIFFTMASAFSQELTKVYHSTETQRNGLKVNETSEVYCDEKFNKENYDKFIQVIGWVYPTNCKVRHIKTSTKGDSYDVIYNINNWGQRTLPQTSESYRHHLIIAGDSNTFGQGVKNSETVPYLLGKKYSDYHPYNFGQRGGGPSNSLALLETKDWASEIPESDGRMIYIYYPSWMAMRVYGTKDYLAVDRGNSPWYDLNEKGDVIRRGNIRDKWISKIFLALSIIDHFHWIGDLPKINIDHIKLISKIFVKMKKEYENKFPKGKFTLVVSDYLISPNDFVAEFIKITRESGVDVVEINKYERQKNDTYHSFDEHFNLKGQQMITDAIAEQIKF